MPLSDGTNAEGEDLSTPLPSEWTAESLTDVVLHGAFASPPCAKVRALLNLTNVKYTRSFGKVKGSAYTKMPVLFVNGRQINDSYIIFKSLAPVLFGQALSDADLKLEELITSGLMISFEREAFGDAESLKKFMSTAGLTGVSGMILQQVVTMANVSDKAVKQFNEKHPNLKSPKEYCVMLKDALEERGTPFYGGDKPGAIDASAYGALCLWLLSGGDDDALPFAKEAVTAAGLEEWYGRVKVEIPGVLDKSGWWPFYT